MDVPDPFFDPPAALAKLKLGRTVDAFLSGSVPLPEPPAGEAVTFVVFVLLSLLFAEDDAAVLEISRRHPPLSSAPPRLGLIVTLGTLLCLPGGTPAGLLRILGVDGVEDPGPVMPPNPSAVLLDCGECVGEPAREP